MNPDVYAMGADGRILRRITTHPAGDLDPAFSPDDRKIVFERAVGGGNHEIFTMNADGSGLRRLTFTATAEGHPSFSPDGSRIVFDDNFHAPPAVRGATSGG